MSVTVYRPLQLGRVWFSSAKQSPEGLSAKAFYYQHSPQLGEQSFIPEGECPWCITTSTTMPNNRSLFEKLHIELIIQGKTEWSVFIHPGDKMARFHKSNIHQKKPESKEYTPYNSISPRFKNQLAKSMYEC